MDIKLFLAKLGEQGVSFLSVADALDTTESEFIAMLVDPDKFTNIKIKKVASLLNFDKDTTRQIFFADKVS